MGLGYAVPLAVQSTGGNNAVCSLINALTGPGAATINLQYFTASQISTIMLPLIGPATNLTALQYAYCQLIFNIILAQTGNIPVGSLSAFGAWLVTTGIITQAQGQAIGQRIGSRAEVLWGQNTVVAEQDVEQAMGETF